MPQEAAVSEPDLSSFVALRNPPWDSVVDDLDRTANATVVPNPHAVAELAKVWMNRSNAVQSLAIPASCASSS